MKTLSLATILFLICDFANAQSREIHYANETFDGISQVAFSIEIEKVETNFVKKRWTSYLKDFDGKLKSHKGEYFLDNAEIKSISPDTLDIYSKLEESGDNVIVYVAINRNGEYINNARGDHTAADDFLLRFATSLKKEKSEDDVEAAEKVLKSLERSVHELKDKNKKLAHSNEQMRNKISDNERTIKSNESSIDEMNRKIQEQDNVVKTLKSKAGEFK